MSSETYTLSALQTKTGVQARTLRHWIRAKLVPKPLGKGRGAHYTARHLLLVRVVQQLRQRRLRLHAIRAQLQELDEQALLALLPPEPRATTPDGVPLPPPEPTYPKEVWEVVPLMAGLVLMVNPAGAPVLKRIADEIYRYYGTPGA